MTNSLSKNDSNELIDNKTALRETKNFFKLIKKSKRISVRKYKRSFLRNQNFINKSFKKNHRNIEKKLHL